MEDPRIEAGRTDVLESPAREPVSRRAAAAGFVLAVLAAATGGYVVGHRRGASPVPAAPAAAPSTAPVGPAIDLTGRRCSQQRGTRLELGVEIVNRSGTAASLRPFGVKLPLAGLRPGAKVWGGCSQLPGGPGADPVTLPPGGRLWLAMTFDVLVDCPSPLPVQFTVFYDQDGHSGTAVLPGFADLGDVPYSTTKCG
jgi:hypothetical protein